MQTPNQFCLSGLYIKRDTFNSSYLYSPKLRTSRYHLGIIEEGFLTVSHLNETISANNNDIIFFPKGVQHISKWHGNPNIRKWDIMFSFSTDIFPDFTIQKISGISSEIIELTRSMYYNSNSSPDNIPFAFADFYKILGLILPHLKTGGDAFISKTLVNAMEYIKTNLSNDMKISDIARYCNICESALYHLFQNELRTTPINYINSLRVAQAIEYMKRDRSMKLSLISSLCGFNSDTHFRKTFFKFAHTTPSEYRKFL